MSFDQQGNFEISEEELVQAFSVAFASVLERDEFLFEKSRPQERAFMHRFAQELRMVFAFAERFRIGGKPVISLDVEYNRDGCDVKRPGGDGDQTKHRWIAPDIILHERGSKDNDYRNDIFVCEMKKAGSECKEDARRLREDFLGARKYRYGIDFYAFAEKDPNVKSFAFDLYKRENVEVEKYVFDKRNVQFAKV